MRAWENGAPVAEADLEVVAALRRLFEEHPDVLLGVPFEDCRSLTEIEDDDDR